QRQHTTVSLLDLAADTSWLLRESACRKKQSNGGSGEHRSRHIRLVHYEHPPDLAPGERPASVRRITPIRLGYSSLFLEQVGFNHIPKFRCHFRTHAKPKLEATNRLMQQHSKPVCRSQTPRPRGSKEAGHQRVINEIGDHKGWRAPQIEFKR